jgi:hypothetical protein
MFLLKQVIESFGYHYKDYIDFLEKFNIFEHVVVKPSSIILLNSTQLEKEMNMLDNIIQEYSLYVHIIFKKPCQTFPAQLKDNYIIYGKNKIPVEFIENRFDIDFYSIKTPIIHKSKPTLWNQCFQILKNFFK